VPGGVELHEATSRDVVVHVPSDAIAAADPEWGAGLLGDKAHSMIFDNAKLRSVVPGYTVLDEKDCEGIEVPFEGKIVQ